MDSVWGRMMKPEPGLRALVVKLLMIQAVFAAVMLMIVIAIALPLVPYVSLGWVAVTGWVLVSGLVVRRRAISTGDIRPAAPLHVAMFVAVTVMMLAPGALLAGGIVGSMLTPHEFESVQLSDPQLDSVATAADVIAPLAAAAGDGPVGSDDIARVVAGIDFGGADATPQVSQTQQETAELMTRVDVWFPDEAVACLSIASQGASDWDGDLVRVDGVSELDVFGEFFPGFCDQE